MIVATLTGTRGDVGLVGADGLHGGTRALQLHPLYGADITPLGVVKDHLHEVAVPVGDVLPWRLQILAVFLHVFDHVLVAAFDTGEPLLLRVELAHLGYVGRHLRRRYHSFEDEKKKGNYDNGHEFVIIIAGLFSF